MTLLQRLRFRLGLCPYCRVHPRGGHLEGHLEWSHASRRNEWEHRLP